MRAAFLLLFLLVAGALAASWWLIPGGPELALIRFDYHDPAGAAAMLEAQLAAYGPRPGIVRPLLDVYDEEGRIDSALALLYRYVDAHPESVEGWRLLADYENQARHPAARLQALQTLYRLKPDNDTLTAIADLSRTLDLGDLRIRALGQMAALGIATTDDREELAERLARNGDRKGALHIMLRLLQARPRPENADWLSLAAALAADLGDQADIRKLVVDRLAAPADYVGVTVIADAVAQHHRTDLALAALEPEAQRLETNGDALATLTDLETAAGRAELAFQRLDALDRAGRMPDLLLGTFVDLAAGQHRPDAALRAAAHHAGVVNDTLMLGLVDLATAGDVGFGAQLDALARALPQGWANDHPTGAAALALARGDRAQAVADAARAEAHPPEAVATRLALAHIDLELDRKDQAIALLSGLAAAAGDDDLADLARLYLDVGRGEEGYTLFTRLRRDRPSLRVDAAWALLALATGRGQAVRAWFAGEGSRLGRADLIDLTNTASDAGQLDEALTFASVLADRFPDPQTRRIHAVALLAAGRPREALLALSTLPATDPDIVRIAVAAQRALGNDAAAYQLLVGLQRRGGLPDDLRGDYIELALAAGDTAGALAVAEAGPGATVPVEDLRTLIARLAGRSDDLAELARHLGPDFLSGQPTIAADLALARGDRAQALRLADEAGRRNDLTVADRSDLARLNLRLGRPDLALDQANRLLEAAGLDDGTLGDLAQLYIDLNRPGDGLARLDALHRASPTPAIDAAWARLAAAAGRAKAVAAWLAGGGRLDPAAFADVVGFARQHGDHADALAVARAYQSAYPGSSADRLLGITLAEAGQGVAALPLLRPFVPGDTDTEDAWLSALHQAGRRPELQAYLLHRLADPSVGPARRADLAAVLVDNDQGLAAGAPDAQPAARLIAADIAGAALGDDALPADLALLGVLDPAAALAPYRQAAARAPDLYGDDFTALLQRLGRTDEAVRFITMRLDAMRSGRPQTRARRDQLLYDLLAIGGPAPALPYLEQAARGGGPWPAAYEDALTRLHRTGTLKRYLAARAAEPGVTAAERRDIAAQLVDLHDPAAADPILRRLAAAEPPGGADADQLLYLWGPRPSADALAWLEQRARSAAPAARGGWLDRLNSVGAYRRTIAVVEAAPPAPGTAHAEALAYLNALAGIGARDRVDALVRRETAASQDPAYLKALAAAADAAGATPAAATAHDAVLKTAPDDATALSGAARAAFADRRYADAKGLFGRLFALPAAHRPAALRDDPTDHYDFGETLLTLGDRSAARAQFQAAFAIYSRLRRPPFALRETGAKLLHRLGRDDAAVAAFNRLLAERPHDVDLRADYAGMLLDMGRLSAARAIAGQT